MRLWDTATWTTVAAIQMPDQVASVAISPDGAWLASADSGGRAELWPLPDPATYKASGSVFFPQFLDRGRVLASTSGGPRGDVEKVLAEGDDSGQVRLWDVADPSRPVPLARLARSRGKVLGLAMCPDGKVLATASTDGHVYLWVIADPKRPKLLAALPRYPGYLFTATSRRPSAPAAGSWPKAGKPARYACGT